MTLKFKYFLLQLLVILSVYSVTALKCDKLVTKSGKPATDDDVFNEGLYQIKTTLQSRSAAIQNLLSSLSGVSNISYTSRRIITATLQPRHIKKLCRNQLVRFIKQLHTPQQEFECSKLVRGKKNSVVEDSYIVIAKKGSVQGQAAINAIQIASDDVDSSVMIASAKPLYGQQGSIVKMNNDGVKYLCNNPLVDYIEEDQVMEGAAITQQWHLDRVDQQSLPLNNQYSSPNNGSGVDVYIFDTGIRYDHEEFEGRALYAGYDPVDHLTGRNNQGYDCHGHGTHVGGLVAGKTFGVAPGATLYSMRVLDCGGKGSTSLIMLGLNHVIGVTQQKKSNRRVVINMSLSTSNAGTSRALTESIQAVLDTGILVVAAAGNFRDDACKYVPSSIPDVLTVGGTQQNDQLYKQLFYGSNYGSCVDIFAPGQFVMSASPNSKISTAPLSGTSQAAPIVSGAVAIYWTMMPNSSPQAVKDFLKSTCTRDVLDFSDSVPPIFVDQTINCLLHIAQWTPPQVHNLNTVLHVLVPKLPYEVFYSVQLKDMQELIEQQQKLHYTASYIQMHSNGTNMYTLVFKNMEGLRFKTAAFVTEQEFENRYAELKPKGFQVKYLHDINILPNLVRLVATFVKNKTEKRTFKALVRIPFNDQIKKVSEESSKGMMLLSTSVGYKNGNHLFTSVYVSQSSPKIRYTQRIQNSRLLGHINSAMSNGYYLKHLSSFVDNKGAERYSLVFYKQVKPAEKYNLIFDAKEKRLRQLFNKLNTQGYTLNVVASTGRRSGEARYIAAYELL